MSEYLDKLLKKKSGPFILGTGVYPNTKEITEAYGMLTSISHGSPSIQDIIAFDAPQTLALVVGDGCTPRLGVLLAMFTKWEVISVDPIMKQDWQKNEAQGSIDRLVTLTNKIEDIPVIHFTTAINNIVVFYPHSHASTNYLSELAASFNGNLAVVTMPCCTDCDIYTDQRKRLRPDYQYKDNKIKSPKNEVNIFLPDTMDYFRFLNAKHGVVR